MRKQRGKSNLRSAAILSIVLGGTCCHLKTAGADCGEGADCAADVAASSSESNAAAPLEKERIKSMWMAGIITFSTVYVSTIISSAALSDPGVKGRAAGYCAIPLIGPFVFMGAGNDEYYVRDQFKGLLIASGVVQILSFGVFMAGWFIKRDVKKKTSRFYLMPEGLLSNRIGASAGWRF